MPALAASFDATGLVLGDATARVPGLRVRYTTRPGPDGSLDLDFEGHGPPEALAQVVEGLKARYRAVVHDESHDDQGWRARVTYNDLSSVLDHPLYGPFLAWRGHGRKATFHFENGLCVVRVEFEAGEKEAQGMLATLRTNLKRGGVAGDAHLGLDPDDDAVGNEHLA